jgi:hypothetical protein
MRLGKFLGFLGLQGTLEDKARFFADKGKYDSTWALEEIRKLCEYLDRRIKLQIDRRDFSCSGLFFQIATYEYQRLLSEDCSNL